MRDDVDGPMAADVGRENGGAVGDGGRGWDGRGYDARAVGCEGGGYAVPVVDLQEGEGDFGEAKQAVGEDYRVPRGFVGRAEEGVVVVDGASSRVEEASSRAEAACEGADAHG